MVLEVCGTPTTNPLQGAVLVHLTTFMKEMGVCTGKIERGERYKVKEA